MAKVAEATPQGQAAGIEISTLSSNDLLRAACQYIFFSPPLELAINTIGPLANKKTG